MPTMGIIHSGSKDNQDQEKQIATLILHLEGEGYVHGQDGFASMGRIGPTMTPRSCAATPSIWSNKA